MAKRYKTLASSQAALRRTRLNVCDYTIFDQTGADSEGGYLIVIWMDQAEDRAYVEEEHGFLGRHPARREDMEARLRVAFSKPVDKQE